MAGVSAGSKNVGAMKCRSYGEINGDDQLPLGLWNAALGEQQPNTHTKHDGHEWDVAL
jgi:hypothetical protein